MADRRAPTSIPNRRRLLQGAVAAGVLGLTGLPLRAQSRGGTLVAGLGGAHPSDSWDARGHSDLFMIAAGQGAVFDCLTEIAADGSLKGELAESWDSTDGQTWVFNLRRGVRFHNGADFGPADVIASLNLHRDDDRAFGAGAIVRLIDDMRASGPYQVTLKLTAPNADFPYLLSDHHLLIYPAGQIDAAMRDGIGTGLYRVTSFQPGRRMTAVRVDDHYKGETAGWFDRIDYVAMNDPAARLLGLVAGRVDAINRVAPSDVATIAAHPRLSLQQVSGNQHDAFHVSHGPAAHHLRAALRHGIDRQAWVDDLLAGYGQVAADSPIGPANPHFQASHTQACDPERAGYHLAQAGFGAARITGSWGATGPRISLRDASGRGVLTCAAIGSAGRATADWMLLAAYGQATDGIEGSERFRDLLRQGRSTMDADRRDAIYAEAQMLLRDQGRAIIPAFATTLQAVSTRIGTPAQLGHQRPMDDARMAERWWMA
ncbi:hypothetical protein AN189_01230 [Loktanella sp. 3ANDIMAR09]|uniref:ABC transporter substrate-binding protein n=1 Tax=Loktanella sp. 3ANDIMAR09 TaxID=1225657 RepID=UPI0006F54AAC|nr:ABC transporter substrate-binding protein [Loktanella sp. 3ANDIMAR09]KQI70050.1 hypothetical protein AN189_01230 [Loktanella sp. 3ANDIMAR09]